MKSATKAAVQIEKNLPLCLADLLSSSGRVRFGRCGSLFLLPRWLVCKAKLSDHGNTKLGKNALHE